MQTLYDVGDRINISIVGHVHAIEITEDCEKYSIELDMPFAGDPFRLNRLIMTKKQAIETGVKKIP